MNQRFKDYRVGKFHKPGVSSIAFVQPAGAFERYPAQVLEKVRRRARHGLYFRKGPVYLNPLKRNSPGTRDRLNHAKDLLNRKALDLWTSGLRYKRTLGIGGQGLAALFQVRNARGKTMDIVAKLVSPSTDKLKALRQEKMMQGV